MVTVSDLQRAINQKCAECCGGMRSEITHCKLKGCALYAYRPFQAPSAAPATRPKGKQVSVFEVLEAAR